MNFYKKDSKDTWLGWSIFVFPYKNPTFLGNLPTMNTSSRWLEKILPVPCCIGWKWRFRSVYFLLQGIVGCTPAQRTPMGNPYISPILRGYLWVIIFEEYLEQTKIPWVHTVGGYNQFPLINEEVYVESRMCWSKVGVAPKLRSLLLWNPQLLSSLPDSKNQLATYIIYTWNPNGAPCFDWNFGLVLEGSTTKNRGLSQVPGITHLS